MSSAAPTRPADKLILTRREKLMSRAEHAAKYHKDPGNVTPQALAGLRRSRRAAASRHERDWGMLAEVVEGPTVEDTVEERIERQNAATAARFQDRRDREAAQWREARRRLRETPREQAEQLVAEWNASTAGHAEAVNLLVFLDERAPTPERIAERRAARHNMARIHREVCEKGQTWWIRHVGCPEGEHGFVDRRGLGPLRHLYCYGCEKEWRSRADLEAADATGELVIVDCRRAVQEALL